ncbi:MAG: hypothetical protein KH135_02275 [Firmicutes bacterium]|nr:hypothetical protein [Bacillota bacterium]
MNKKYPYEDNYFYQMISEEIDGKENQFLVFYDRILNTFVKVLNITNHTLPKQNMVTKKEITVCNLEKLNLTKAEKKSLNELYELATKEDIMKKISTIMSELKVVSIYQKNAKLASELSKELETIKLEAKQVDREIPIFTSKRLSKHCLELGKYLETLKTKIKQLESKLNHLSNVSSTFGLVDTLKNEVHPLEREAMPLIPEEGYDDKKSYAVIKGDFPILGVSESDIYELAHMMETMKKEKFYNREDQSTIISPKVTKEMQGKIEKRFSVWTTYQMENGNNPISALREKGTVIKRELVYAKDEEGTPCKVADITDANCAKEISLNTPVTLPIKTTKRKYEPFHLESVLPSVQEKLMELELLLEDEELFRKLNVVTDSVKKIKTIDFREKEEFQTYKEHIARLNDMESREFDFSYNKNIQDKELLKRQMDLNNYYGQVSQEATYAWNELLKYQHTAFGYVNSETEEIYTMFDSEVSPLGVYNSPELKDRIGGVVGPVSPYFLNRESIEELYEEVKRIQRNIKPTEKKLIK